MVRSFGAGLLIGVMSMIGCAAMSYKHYNIEVPHYDGWLRGDKPEHDLPFSSCEPTVADKNPCQVVFREEWIKLLKDLADYRQRAIACEEQHQ